MKLLEVMHRIGNEFQQARTETFRAHPLAKVIRDDWVAAIDEVMDTRWKQKVVVKSSAGIRSWNAAPWLALLHTSVTSSAREGYYPVFLFEPGLTTYCLVLVQGADQLQKNFGKREALRVVDERSTTLREAAPSWTRAGFTPGPFRTFSQLESDEDIDSDGWSASVAFGKRYSIVAPPSADELRIDLDRMLAIYDRIAVSVGTRFVDQDQFADSLKASGELPPNGLDGVLKLYLHKKIEQRARSGKLARHVRAHLGSRCQGCAVDLASAYPGIGEAFAEAHYVRAESNTISDGIAVSVEDFAILCPTCHRIIHRLGCPAVDEFQGMVSGELRKSHRSG